jgi:hypothetical protein
VSALLSLRADPEMKAEPSDVFEQLSAGYRECVSAGGEPLVLMERHGELRRMATQELRQPAEFWKRMEAKIAKPGGDLPDGLCRAFRKLLPASVEPAYRVLREPKGLGSLGRRRFLALATWEGGLIAREAKDVVPSAVLWAAKERAGKGNPWLEKTVSAAVRCEDPFYTVKGRWLVRRLAPDCSRIDLEELKHHENFSSLLYSMGWETANIHLGTPKIRRDLLAALRRLPAKWLEEASHIMLEKSLEDWRAFRKSKDRR